MVTLTVTRSRIASMVTRLRRRGRIRIAPADSLDTLLEAATEAGAVVTVPGLLDWLGYSPRTVDPDFKASIDGKFTESFEDYCTRISRKEAAS